MPTAFDWVTSLRVELYSVLAFYQLRLYQNLVISSFNPIKYLVNLFISILSFQLIHLLGCHFTHKHLSRISKKVHFNIIGKVLKPYLELVNIFTILFHLLAVFAVKSIN